jgi:seryl-tRNA synthetase
MARFSMLDIGLVRRDPDRVKRSAIRRGLDPSFVDEVLRYDEEYRSALSTAETAKAEKNRISAEIGRATDKAAAAVAQRERLNALTQTIGSAEERARALSPERDDSPLRTLLSSSPNLLDDSVPDGTNERDNIVVREYGTPATFSFEPRPHWVVGETLGILDFERAAKLSGSRFTLLRGKGARLSRALASFFLDSAAARGYLEIAPPYLVSRSTMWSTGQLSKFADAMFRDPDADLFMIPTSEVPLTAMHGDEILPADSLPRQYTAHTPCFRKEAGAAGKDTRGLIRLHQFEKVELIWLSAAETSFDALDRLLADAEHVLQMLDLPYRVVSLCAGDTGFNAAKTYDLEVWMPSAGVYREISSCSNCTDFQARRSAIRTRRADGKTEFVHTLNGSALAIGRTIAALLENFQRQDGAVDIPAALQPYTGFDRIEPQP